ncbi:MAG: YraN family protein [Patescibacteria group bacterium]
MTREKRNLGDWGEEQACGFLRRNGFRIVDRNFQTTAGEIDIVAEKGGDYYFVEVKTRADKEFANDLAVTYFKKRKLAKTIKAYCYKRDLGEVSVIMAALVVFVDRQSRKVNFRFTVLIEPL